MIIKKAERLRGEIRVPGDKSISHRGVMLGSIAEGNTLLTGFLNGADCISTMECFREMGVEIKQEGEEVQVRGAGLRGLRKPGRVLDAGNSGTTMRILSGILSGQPFEAVLDGDASLRKRPMKRIIDPLTEMGADICSEGGFAPLRIQGGELHGIAYESPAASAQVKSSILLAGLYAEGETRVKEPFLSRNHTELMLRAFGADCMSEGNTACLRPGRSLHGISIRVPGDISSAAYFLGAGLLVPDSEVVIKEVGINPTRSGILDVLKRMKAEISVENTHETAGEMAADLIVRSSSLVGTKIGGEEIPRLIDELPLIAVLAAVAEGQTVIRDAAELKVKESDRITLTVGMLKDMGAVAYATEDGMVIEGSGSLCGARIRTDKDHRIAMSAAVAGLIAEGETEICDPECVRISYPGFFDTLERLKH